MTKEELKRKILATFGDTIRVDVSGLPTEILMNSTKITFYCAVHGKFVRTATDIFRRGGCPACNRAKGRSTISDRLLEKFKLEAPIKFNNKFTYDYSTFCGHRKPMRMVCPEHGEFWAEPSRHLHTYEGGGCNSCGTLLKRKSKAATEEEVIAKAKEVHGDYYTYISVSSVADHHSSKDRTITYKCPVHGMVTQTVEAHIFKKNRCRKCAHAQTSVNYLRDINDVIKELEGLFPGRLSFEKLVYKGGVELFTLICKEHNQEFRTNLTNIRTHPSFYSCPVCSPQCDSGAQRAIFERIRSLGLEALYNDRKALGGKEIDILIPSLNMGIEYNGSFWHSERCGNRSRFHIKEKQELAAGMGLTIVNFSDSIDQEKIINFVKAKAGLLPRVYARKTTVKSINHNVSNGFLNKFHIQGGVNGGTSYGLFLNNKLVGVAVFSVVNSERGNKDRARWELRRMAFSCSVIGGASKLLKAFIKGNEHVSIIVSYSDNRWFSGNVYKVLGFRKVKICEADYAYTKGGRLYHKAQFKHSELRKKKNFVYDENLTEVQNCMNNGYYRIWDCGKKKWELTVR